jgi:hypothetical protein
LLFVLRALTRVPLERPHVRPVESRDHLEGLVRYFLGQPRKHQLRAHPALYTGTCFSDLIGARTIGDFQPRIFEALPRFRAERACDQVGVPKAVLRPASDEQLRVAGVARLVAAAAAALCVGPELRGKAPAMLDARRLAVHLTDRCGLPRAELPRLLGVSPRTVRRLAHESVSPLALRAARLQIALVDTIHQLPAAVVRAG